MTTKTDTIAHLHDMHAKITQGWCRGMLAQDKDGREIAYDSDNAAAWCLTGAYRTTRASYDTHALRILREVVSCGLQGLTTFNDRAESKDEVLDVINKAITYAEQELP